MYIGPVADSHPELTIHAARIGAEHGSARAMRDLANALRQCALLQESTERQVIAAEVRKVRNYELFARDAGRPYDRRKLDAEAEANAANRLAMKQDCSSMTSEDAGQWLDWLERAAVAGDLDAKREFAQAVITIASDAASALARADELARRKREAFHFLDDVLKSGDCTVSTHMELLAPDPVESYVYSVVTFEWGKAIQPQIATPELAAQNIEFMESELAKKASKLTPSQVRAARKRGVDVYNSCRR